MLCGGGVAVGVCVVWVVGWVGGGGGVCVGVVVVVVVFCGGGGRWSVVVVGVVEHVLGGFLFDLFFLLPNRSLKSPLLPPSSSASQTENCSKERN